ncbi:hypothetical protein [Streptomyces sp. GESEQ-35]|uniref:hypothetical protein n=1 Tax=Streptomyces sp. GESEQ-35 TaxID=2812657 RepID=UPI001B32C7BF|nr:hypothetical protein [Streptomyces sp. GESEQ-35]
MRTRIARLMLRQPLGRHSRLRRRALETVLRAADSGAPAALRATARALDSLGPETVWRTWLRPTVSGASPRRWTSPLVAELAGGETAVPDVLVDAGWRDWLDEHQVELWALLRRWNRAAPKSDHRLRFLSRLALDGGAGPGRGEAAAAWTLAHTAARFDHPIGEQARARLLTCDDPGVVDLFCAVAVTSGSPDPVTFCTAHRLAPSDTVERAVFFVRTGQHEQYRVLDPDGVLLAAHYRDAPPEARSALREAMTRLGGIDVLRVLAGQRRGDQDIASLSRKERAYLTRQFSEQRDWDRLWPFAVLLPLADAVKVVHAFGDWRPPGEDDRRVFEALLAAGPVTRQLKALSTAPSAWGTPHSRITLGDLAERASGVVDVDFAPDGRRLAFVGLDRYAGTVDLGSGTLTRLRRFAGPLTGVAHLGSGAVVVVESCPDRGGRGRHCPRLAYCDDDGRRTLSFGGAHITGIRQLRRIAGDGRFVVLAAQRRDGVGGWALFAGEADGTLADTGVFSSGRPHPGLTAAVAPEGRLIAVLDPRTALIADLAAPVVAALDNGRSTAEDRMPYAALSPSLLVRGSHEGRVQVWRDPLTARGAPVSGGLWRQDDRRLIGLAWSPALRRFLALSLQEGEIAVHLPRLRILDAPASHGGPVPGTLVPKPIALGRTTPRTHPFMRLSPRGDVLAVCNVLPGHIDLYALSPLMLRPFIGKPMGLMSHRDLTDVVTVLENPVLDEEARTTLTLLRTCLEHRFRHDVEIGAAHGRPAGRGRIRDRAGRVRRMARTLGTQDAVRLTELAARRRADGSRGRHARRAWRRVVQACAEADPALQEAVRAAGLPDADVLDLLAVAPAEPADRAAYLALIGQDAQRRAMDPDGSLLALAYRAAAPGLRERLRALIAAEGDTEVIRVVVTGERRDRIAELSYDELDYLGHQLAEHQDWAEVRRLARDLPLAKAATAARLLPVPERTEGMAELLSEAPAQSPRQLQALIDRLPARPLITHDILEDRPVASQQGASFSPDSSEVALRYVVWKSRDSNELHVETLRIGTGEVTSHFGGKALTRREIGNSILHLGDEILVRLVTRNYRHRIVRILPTYGAVGEAALISDLRRASRGAVVLSPGGPAFVDPASDSLRYRPNPCFTKESKIGDLSIHEFHSGLTTLPAAHLIAFCSFGDAYVATEDGEVLHTMAICNKAGNDAFSSPALSFLSRNSLALHLKPRGNSYQYTEIWELPADGEPRRTEQHVGAIRNRWPLEKWRVPLLDDAFAARVYISDGSWSGINPPWLQGPASDERWTVGRSLLAVTPGQDMYVVGRESGSRASKSTAPICPPHVRSWNSRCCTADRRTCGAYGNCARGSATPRCGRRSTCWRPASRIASAATSPSAARAPAPRAARMTSPSATGRGEASAPANRHADSAAPPRLPAVPAGRGHRVACLAGHARSEIVGAAGGARTCGERIRAPPAGPQQAGAR